MSRVNFGAPKPGRRKLNAAYRAYLLPHERCRLDDIQARLDELAAEAKRLQNLGNSRRQHAIGRSSMAKRKAAQE